MIVPEIVKEKAGKCVGIFYKGLFQGLHIFRVQRRTNHGAKIGLPLFIVYNEEKQTAYRPSHSETLAIMHSFHHQNQESHLVEQWIEESKQMGFSKEESEFIKENLRQSSADEVHWEISVPYIYPKGTDIYAVITGEIETPKASIDEHDAVVKGIKAIHNKEGFDKADDIYHYYVDIYCKRNNAPEENFDFNKLLEAYNNSASK